MAGFPSKMGCAWWECLKCLLDGLQGGWERGEWVGRVCLILEVLKIMDK